MREVTIRRGKIMRTKWTGERIKELRKQYDELQEPFAARLRVKVHTVRAWEQNKGEPSGPATILLDQLEAALHDPSLRSAIEAVTHEGAGR